MSTRNKFKCIYVLLGPSKTAYVGQTTDPINRKSRYKTLTCKNQTNVYNSLLTHGYDKHEFSILIRLADDATRGEMDFYEKFYFSLYQEAGYKMLNLKSPGWNGRPCQESKDRSSKAHIGNRPWNIGTKGVCKAWNKGKHKPRLVYSVKRDGEIIKIDDLMAYCKQHSIDYTTMVTFLKGKRSYSNRKKYKEYERI